MVNDHDDLDTLLATLEDDLEGVEGVEGVLEAPRGSLVVPARVDRGVGPRAGRMATPKEVALLRQMTEAAAALEGAVELETALQAAMDDDSDDDASVQAQDSPFRLGARPGVDAPRMGAATWDVVKLLREIRDGIQGLVGPRERGALDKRDLDRGRRLWNDATGNAQTGALWNGPPMINRETGRTFAGVLLSCPRLGQRGPGQLGTGAVVEITVGDGGGGELGHRTVVIGDGFPIFVEAGKYGYFHANVTTLGNNNHAPMISWCDGSVLTAIGGAVPWQAPMIAGAGIPIPERVVPEGAFEVWSRSAAALTWRDYSPGGGATDTMITNTPAQTISRVFGHTVETDVDTNLRFFLAPL